MTTTDEEKGQQPLTVTLSMEDRGLEDRKKQREQLGVLATLFMGFQTLGIIYGDIGTSPLYVYYGIFPSGDPPSSDDVFGALSLIIWSLTIVPLFKYVIIVLRADDNGQGGTFALYSLLSRHIGVGIRGNHKSEDLKVVPAEGKREHLIARNPAVHKLVLVVVFLGVSSVMSDGLLTPAISVISAVEGMELPSPNLESGVVPLSCAILLALFLLQRFGTDKVSNLFAPIVALWLFSLASIGIWNISQYPEIMKAYSPYYAFKFFIRNGDAGFTALGGVLLAITGVEALYADLGHFNRTSIQITFPFLVYIPLVLAYMGQGARLVLDPTIISTTFWSTVPSVPAIYWSVFVIATLATIIASQAMISATFSLVYQAMQLDCFPRVKIVHTSTKHEGQIYIPEVNYILMVLVVIICAIFKHSANLTIAYGVAVSLVMGITTFLFSMVIHSVFGLPKAVSVVFLLFFGTIDLVFLGATLRKVGNGGWFTLSVAGFLTMVMTVWQWGTILRVKHEMQSKIDLDNIFSNIQKSDSSDSNDDNKDDNKDDLHPRSVKFQGSPEVPYGSTSSSSPSPSNALTPRKRNEIRLLKGQLPIYRFPGFGLFYQEAGTGVPLAFYHFIRHFPAMPKILVFISVRTVAIPVVDDAERIVIRKVPEYEGTYRVVARYGYMEPVRQSTSFIRQLYEAISRVDPQYVSTLGEVDVENEDVTYTFSKQNLQVRPGNALRVGLLSCYVFLVNNSRELFGNWDIPAENVIDVGMKVIL